MCTCGTNVVSMMVASRASTQQCSLEYDGEQHVVTLEEKQQVVFQWSSFMQDFQPNGQIRRVYTHNITLRGHFS